MQKSMHALWLLASTAVSVQGISPAQIPLGSTQHSQGYEFDPLLHLPGTSPYFDAVGYGLEHQAPLGCTVESASYLIRHGAIYANDDEYEDFIKPFLTRLDKNRGGFSGPLEFLNRWRSPIEEDSLEELTPSGMIDAQRVGSHIVQRYPDLVRTVEKIIADTKSRTFDTARAFIKTFTNQTAIDILRLDKKDLNNATRAVLPHKACSKFSKKPGKKEHQAFVKTYGPAVAARLRPYTPRACEFTPSDILAMQSICGYESAILGAVSPMCGVFTDSEWYAYEYGFDMKYAYMVGPYNNLSHYLGLPWLAAQSEIFDSIDRTGETPFGWPKSQRFFMYFTHREVPPMVATALGLFNSSSSCGNDEFPTTHINWARSWKMADLIPFLGHVGMEKLVCERPDVEKSRGSKSKGKDKDKHPHREKFIRFTANTAPRPLQNCQSGPGASCPFEEFKRIIKAAEERYGDFDGVCGNKKESDV